MDLLCIEFTKVDPSKSGKENILVLTDTFTKFSQAFVTPNMKVLTVAKILVDKQFYIYGIPAQIHSNQGQCFDNQIMKHLYALYSIEQSTTMPYNLHGNAHCKQFNCMIIGCMQMCRHADIRKSYIILYNHIYNPTLVIHNVILVI